MSRRPVIGLPACIKRIDDHPFHAVGVKYVDAVHRAANALPLLLPALGEALDIAHVLEQVDGILLTGSVSNIAPERFGQQLPRPEMGTKLDLDRDATTFPLIGAALAAGKPIFAICRGFQEMNVALGGTLHQEVHAQSSFNDHREQGHGDLEREYGPAHTVKLTTGGRLQEILGGMTEISVNSLHGQGIDQLGQGLSIEARAADGLIEAVSVSHARAFAMAVQWHPEWKVMDNPQSLAIFHAFGHACAERSRIP